MFSVQPDFFHSAVYTGASFKERIMEAETRPTSNSSRHLAMLAAPRPTDEEAIGAVVSFVNPYRITQPFVFLFVTARMQLHRTMLTSAL